ncbi:MAG TPA: efflux RND transporter periplasmic adaptor subunit [Gemmatimonadales bacterium]|jgi:RND family efflux transporter MFP subunit
MRSRLALAVLTACAISACHRGAAAAADAPTPAVDVAADNIVEVDSGLVESGPTVSGTLTPQRSAELRAQLAGAILALPVQEGTVVHAGQMVAVIDTAVVAEAVRSARSQLVSAKLAAEVAQRNEERSNNLHSAGAISDHDMELAHNQTVAAVAAAADATSKLTTAQRQLANGVVRAPFDGVVSARPTNVGDVLSIGNPILTIVDPSDLELQGSVGADALATVKTGIKVEFSVNGNPGKIFEGHVTRINPTVDSVTRQVKIYISVPNHDHGLAGGLYAQGRVTVASVHALEIPIAALDPKVSTPTVRRVKNGVVAVVPITTGVRDELSERIQVSSGLAFGDTLLVGAALSTPAASPIHVTKADH